MPVVSVLMPCYNAAATLPEALRSLQQQTRVDFEIVAVDDGSTDGTLQQLQQFAAVDDRLRYFSIPHSGIVGALNAGLAHCLSGYIARMDADDRSHPERLARQSAYLDGRPEIDLAGCRVAAFPSEDVGAGFVVYLDWLNSLVKDEDIRREIFVESPLPHPSWMLRRAALQAAGGYRDCDWAEDYDLLLRLYLNGARFAKLEQVLLEWREHPGRLTRTDSRYALDNFLRLKAFYLMRGPLAGRDAVIVWGAGRMGRWLGKQLASQAAPLVVYADVDPRKIGRTRRGLPIIPAQELHDWWRRYRNPVILAAVGTRGARPIVRARLNGLGFREGADWWLAA